MRVVNGGGPPRPPREVRRRLRAAVHNLRAGKPVPDGETGGRPAGYSASVYAASVYMTAPRLGRELLAGLRAHAR